MGVGQLFAHRVGAGAPASGELRAGLRMRRVTRLADQTGAHLRDIERDLLVADQATRDLTTYFEAEVEDGMTALDRMRSRTEILSLTLAMEGAERGLHLAGGYSLPDWVALRSPGLTRHQAVDLARVADACREAVHAPILDGIRGAGFSVATGAAVLRALARVRSAIDATEYAQAVELLAQAAANPRLDERARRKLLGQFVATCLSGKEKAEREKSQRAMRSVHESSLADGTLRRFIITVGEDADYETIKAILDSPLAAPASKEEVDATGEPDLRSPGNRRYDALMTVLRRGVAGTKGQPTTPKAKVAVSINFDAIIQQLGELGVTASGEVLSPDVVRRIACDAELIPMVLGTEGEILDLGRGKRLVTPGQREYLAHRDGGCTIPGCTVPATWCDAHHVVHWSRGGASDVDNYALLCPRHHTWVHVNDKMAIVSALGVIWLL